MIGELAAIAAACDISVAPGATAARSGSSARAPSSTSGISRSTARRASRCPRSGPATPATRSASPRPTASPGFTSGSSDLLADREVAVVDIAVVPEAQVEIALPALDAGKDVMCQKPLALDSADARRIVERADALGRRVAVQQQMRFEEGIMAARAMVRAGWIGEVTSITIDVNIATDFASWGWLGLVPRLEIYFHSIHYVDTVRAFLGRPDGGLRDAVAAARARSRSARRGR